MIRVVASLLVACASPAFAQTALQKQAIEGLDPLFTSFMRENHIPGVAYGVVLDGKLVHVGAFGVQDTQANAPVTADTVFRIASMSKNFTALAMLKLRDAGRLRFDEPAETYVPELASLKYPTTDSPKITVRDLLTHSAGFVTDDPWGDRQTPLPEEEFTDLLWGGIAFSRPPQMAHEYSNLGYALVGRIVSNVSARYYSDYITDSFLKPLGMKDTGYDYTKVPAARRAIGYRWEENQWKEEPVMGPGAFGAMGGVMTTANDYARYVSWILAAWPPRDDAEDGILKRASIREIGRPGTFLVTAEQPEFGCPRTFSYSLGMRPTTDCKIGPYITHSGGYPGYGSNVVFIPDRGIGIFAFGNRTYAPMANVVRLAAAKLSDDKLFPSRATPVNATHRAAAEALEKVFEAGNVLLAREMFAVNILMDRSAALRNQEINTLKRKVGKCQKASGIEARTALSGVVTFPCEKGTVLGRFNLAPTPQPLFQTLEFLQ